MESRYIHKSHNVSVLMYHVVCPAKYRRVVMGEHVDEVLRQTCLEIEKRWEIRFLEIGLDRDYAHFLIQSVPTYSATRIMTTVIELDRARGICEGPRSEAAALGRRVLGQGIFRKHGWAARQRKGDRRVRPRARRKE